jgi:hypothetical protein
MKPLRLYFKCSGKFSELQLGDLETSELFVEDLISMTLKSLPFPVIVKPVRLYFSPTENAYIIPVRIWYYTRSSITSDEAEIIEFQIEARISHALLQFCQTVCADNCNCWQQI